MICSIENVAGIKKILFSSHVDGRGDLSKIYRKEIYEFLMPNIEEIYFSRSKKNVIRGLHYQMGDKAQDKLVYCTGGHMLDISVDLRKGIGFGYVHVEELSGCSSVALLIPSGFAHGVISLSDSTSFICASPKPYSPDDERGVLWNSLGIDFGIKNPIVSEKDQSWPSLDDTLKFL